MLEYLSLLLRPELSFANTQLNILVNAENRAVITDFGSARLVDPASREATADEGTTLRQLIRAGDLKAEVAATGEFITMTGPAWTIRWAAPELLDGWLPGLPSDIWAFGWVCWEVCQPRFCTARGISFSTGSIGHHR